MRPEELGGDDPSQILEQVETRLVIVRNLMVEPKKLGEQFNTIHMFGHHVTIFDLLTLPQCSFKVRHVLLSVIAALLVLTSGPAHKSH